ncbi:putative clathrin assembly protein [Prunus yedoensis var. nudiflora]|uniref:Putative clathrin assembly protein n=1 Tax=Prunus yedoensis var. nudiflora TaxID=2094558 RepID=A0A314ZN14_PRUYE|nr:putative clathrin assembly protein [Prunus yedoensis var. nudiflora]
MLEVLPQLQSLIDLVMDCRPTGAAAKAFLVQLAMKHIIRDSFMCYTIFRREIVMVLDSLFQMPYRSCISAFDIYKKAAVQANQLCEFYEWCKAMGFCGAYEYPFVDQVPHIQIHALENFLNGMWQLTESSSTPTSSPTSPASVPSSFVEYSSSTSTEDDINKDHILVTRKWEKPLIQFDRGSNEEKPLIQLDRGYDEEKPLIQFEDDTDEEGWESLLEASINMSRPAAQQNNMCFNNNGTYGSYGYCNYRNVVQHGDQKDAWQIQIYNANSLNPFYISHSSGQTTYLSPNLAE